MPEQVGFFTAVTYGNVAKTSFQEHLEIFDDYFCLGGRKVQVIAGAVKGKSQGVEWVNKSSPCFLTCVKVVSYFTVVIPLFMLLAKCILRSQQQFHILKKKNIQKHPTIVKPLSSKINPTTISVGNGISIPVPKESKIESPSSSPPLSLSTTTLSKSPAPVAAPTIRKYTSLTGLHAHFEEALEGLGKLAAAMDAKNIVTNYNKNDFEKVIMDAKASLSDPLAQPIDEKNLFEWKKVFDKLLAVEKSFHLQLINAEKQYGKQYIEEFFPLRIILAKQIDAIVPCLAETFYLIGEMETSELLVKEITHNTVIRDEFYTKFVKDYYDNDLVQEALRVNKQISYSCPSRDPFFFKIAEEYYSARMVKEALDTIVEMNGKSKDVFIVNVAEDFFTIGERERALKTIELVIYDTKTKEQFIDKVAQAYFSNGQLKEALKAIKEISSDTKTKEQLIALIAGSYLYKGEREEALKTIKEISSDTKTKEQFIVKIAESYYVKGERKEALDTIKIISNDTKTKEQFVVKIAESYYVKGERKEALEAIDVIYSDTKTKEFFIEKIAYDYLANGQRGEAIKTIKLIRYSGEIKEKFFNNLSEGWILSV